MSIGYCGKETGGGYTLNTRGREPREIIADQIRDGKRAAVKAAVLTPDQTRALNLDSDLDYAADDGASDATLMGILRRGGFTSHKEQGALATEAKAIQEAAADAWTDGPDAAALIQAMSDLPR